jgi:CheY-specific phosphatase CheX
MIEKAMTMSIQDRLITDASDHHRAARATIQERLVASAIELFAHYGFAAQHVTDTADVTSLEGPAGAAIIGYGGDAVRGALVLLATHEAVKTLVADAFAGGLDNDDDAIRDQLGEFSNMLLGRLKNHLLARGVVLMLSTPTTAFGDKLRLPKPSVGTSNWQEFRVSSHRILVRLDAAFEPSFRMTEPSGEQKPLISEGEMLVF